jgi:3-phenylpropionate/cinnamic acid dioxygenase small subunit
VSIRHSIETTLYRYAWGFDEEDLEALTACFTEDAEMHIRGNALQGREAIVQRLGEMRAARREAGERMRHVMTNVLVHEQDDQRAEVTSYFTSFLITSGPEGQLIPYSTGFYRDELRADGDDWRIARRDVTFDRG